MAAPARGSKDARSRRRSVPSARSSAGQALGSGAGSSAASFSPEELARIERGQINEIQRARLVAGVGQAACEHGAANVTVAQVVEHAGVSRRTFYEIFGDAHECLLAALEDALAHASARVVPVWRAQGSWQERLRGALTELLRLFDEEPMTVRLLVVESLAAGHAVLRRRAQVLAQIVNTLQDERPPSRNGARQANDRGPANVEVEGALGGALGVLHSRLTGFPDGPLSELAGPLMSMLVLPYLGSAAARREMARPAPAPAKSRPESPGGAMPQKDLFKAAGMRLTYRTMRVLDAIAEHPGGSNREIANHAELNDQGQTSKLLARLERVGMILNNSPGQANGEANAWTLTQAGLRLTDSIRLHVQNTLNGRDA